MEVLYEEFFRIAHIIALILFIPVFNYMIVVYKQEKKWELFTVASGFLLLSTIFAIIRGLYLFETFRFLEHCSILVSGIIFAYACYYSHVYLCCGEVK